MNLLGIIGALFSAGNHPPKQPGYVNKVNEPGIKKRKKNRKMQRKARRKNRS